MTGRHIFTSESVTEGHPDKICDQISDAILDTMLSMDKNARVACETAATTGMVLVMGEITTDCYADIPKIVRETIHQIGYEGGNSGFDYETCAVLTAIDEQSPDIAMGVDNAWEFKDQGVDPYDRIGAGDQGMAFGFACRETPELMPAPISYAHKLTQRLAEVRKKGILPFILPDGKAQVTVIYDENGQPERLGAVVVSTQHSDDISLSQLRDAVWEEVIKKVLPQQLLRSDTKIYINPTGRFVIGGPRGDSGLTGRKIIVDTYGGYSSHGGGSFSGKDPTKVDRTGAYMARYAAKNMVASGLCDICEIQLAYAIGVARPVSIYVNSYGTGIISDEKLGKLVAEQFDFRPAAMIEHLNLRRPIYLQTAAYGHFGRPELALPWENCDKAEALAAMVK